MRDQKENLTLGRPGVSQLRSIALRALCCLLVAGLAVWQHRPAVAASGNPDLGRPTSDVPGMYDPLGFHRVAGLTVHGKVPVTLYDTLWDVNSAGVHWPLVKALEQFGTWSGLGATASTQPIYPSGRGANGQTIPAGPTVPTFDLTRARYHSRYVTFAHLVLQVRQNGPQKHLSARQSVVVRAVLRFPDAAGLRHTLPPVVTVGRYGSHGATGFVTGLALSPNAQGVETVQSFGDDLRALQHGETQSNDWVGPLNIYANIVTAYICDQDGRRPATVCGTHAIRYIMSRIK